MMKKIRPWRLNFVVTYLDKDVVRSYRDLIFVIVKNISLLRGIECGIKAGYQPEFEESDGLDIRLQEFVFDILYFRSTQQTSISAKDFRELIKHVFDQERSAGITSAVDVVPQVQSYLPRFPFPG